MNLNRNTKSGWEIIREGQIKKTSATSETTKERETNKNRAEGKVLKKTITAKSGRNKSKDIDEKKGNSESTWTEPDNTNKTIPSRITKENSTNVMMESAP